MQVTKDKTIKSFLSKKSLEKILTLKSIEFKSNWNESFISFSKNLFFFLILITLGCHIASNQFLYLFPLILLLGISFHKLSILLHDICHMNFFPSKKLNLVIGYFISWICFTDFKSYQKSHFLHHLNTGLNNDPELPEIIKSKMNSSVKKYLIKNLFGLILINNKQDFRSRSFTFSSFLGLVLTQSTIYLTLCSFSNTFPFLFGFLWIISSFTFGVFLSRLRGLLEHFPIKKYCDNKVITRSHYCNFFELLIFYGNHMNLHVEHHFNPRIPSYKLPQFSQIIKPYLLEKSYSTSPIKTLRLILDS